MNQLQWIIPTLVELLVGAFVYGQLTQRQKDQGGWLKKHDGQIEKLQDKHVNLEGRVSHMEGRKGLPHGAE